MDDPASVQVPDDLAELDRWAVWRFEGGRKIPYRVDGRRASATNPKDWGEIDGARNVLLTGRYTGLAYAFFQCDGLVGIDLDDCLDADGVPKKPVRAMLERFEDTYCEVSPSGTGLKLWSRGSPANSLDVMLADGIGLEVYARGRYFTFTGWRFRNAPLQVADHTLDIELLYRTFAAKARLCHLPGGKIPIGTQHNRLVAIAGALRRHGVCDEGVSACLLAVNKLQCEQPGPPAHISQIVASSRKWGTA